MRCWYGLVLLVILGCLGAARAQEGRVNSYGAGLVALVPVPQSSSWPTVPQFGLRLGAELELGQDWRLGARVSGSSLLLFAWAGALDGYAAYRLDPDWTVYLGGGAGLWTLLPFPDAPSSLSTDWHGLIGVRLGRDWSLELTPGVASFTRCVPATDAPAGCSRLEPATAFIIGLSFSWFVWF